MKQPFQFIFLTLLFTVASNSLNAATVVIVGSKSLSQNPTGGVQRPGKLEQPNGHGTGSKISAAERIAANQIDHSAWTVLLKRYVDAKGMVNYKAWKRTAKDVRALDRYLDHLSSASFSRQTNRSVKLAFWINAYNAVTVKGILREYPTSSIRNHTAKIFGYNIWDDLKLIVEGKPTSLNQMEHEVLRKMGEPRIHFALVCASIGCPRLLNEAYTANRLEQQLTVNSQVFFADANKFQFNIERKTIAVSPILKWYGEDFGKTTADHMRRIAPLLPKSAQKLAKSGSASVSYLKYDWKLNDQSQAR